MLCGMFLNVIRYILRMLTEMFLGFYLKHFRDGIQNIFFMLSEMFLKNGFWMLFEIFDYYSQFLVIVLNREMRPNVHMIYDGLMYFLFQPLISFSSCTMC